MNYGMTPDKILYLIGPYSLVKDVDISHTHVFLKIIKKYIYMMTRGVIIPFVIV